ncbi:MAG: hypothetical protein OES32_08595 [Acidobacteriota bacterium]|nr:hypothetical protein [Acidobacteriota bacterium]MDH3523630.1 hypothetical protein [Acidobacteriota bacterium]
MNVLGIILHSDFGHPAACLLRDGQLVALGEEERFVRVKRAKGYFPGNSIRYCLEAGGIALQDVGRIAFGWDANKYSFRYPFFLARNFLSHRFLKRTATPSENVGRQSQGSALVDGLKDILSTHPKSLKQSIVFGFREAGFHEDLPPVTFVNHHLCHAATAFYCSGLAESAVLVCDGHGEENTITIWKGQGDKLTPVKKTNIPHSLGWFYSLFTEFLGWSPNEGEVKLMGLAPFGKPNKKIQEIVDSILLFREDSVELNADYIFYNKRSYGRFFSDLLVDKLGMPRGRDDDITDHHRDIAAAVQTRLEQAGVHLARAALQLTNSRNLCLAGGVALNCKMNGHIHAKGFIDHFFVQPVSYDAGAALGAAQIAAHESGDPVRFRMEHVYYGPSYSNDDIESVLQRSKIAFRKSDDVASEAARFIYDGKIVAWFQGRMEVGPRTLGARSILADPRDPAMKDKVNSSVKFREAWRPFALSLLEEHKQAYLEHPVESPFMIMAFGVPAERRKDIQSAMHWVDHTTRPQTVSRKVNPLYWKLIDAFRELSGVPGVLNTSFNVKGEPVVCSPSDALRCFFGTGLDVLVIGDYIVEKPIHPGD